MVCSAFATADLATWVERSLDAVTADVVGRVRILVGGGVWTPAARERAVVAPRARERRVQLTVGHRDLHGVVPHVPAVRQRRRREAGEHGRREGVGLGVIADQLQGVDLKLSEVDVRALLEEKPSGAASGKSSRP
jgi:hypothetical protein